MSEPAGDTAAGGAPSEPALAQAAPRAPGWLARIGLASVDPRRALAIAADRRHAGRSGSDLIAAIAVLLVATQLRWLAAAIWLGAAVSPGLGVRAAMHVASDALAVDLGLLLVGALAVFALAGPRRNLGRAFDLACVAALPLVVVNLVATVVVGVAGIAVPSEVSWLLAGVSFAWMGALIALAIRPARSLAPAPAPPAEALRPARRAGVGIAVIAAIGVAIQAVWIAGNLDRVKPMVGGEAAPAIALPRIGAGGALGEPVTLAASHGRIAVLDFWATWCKPCLAAMPKLDQLARAHPEVDVIAINLDDPAAARALFDQRGYAMTLVADDGHTAERYGVSAIPHTVIVDRRGVVRQVLRGARADLAAIVETLRTSE